MIPSNVTVDIIDRQIYVGDFVVFHNMIYIVEKLPAKPNGRYGMVTIMLANPSKTTRPQKKHSKDLCILPKLDAEAFLESTNGRH